MTSYVTPKKNSAFITYVGLPSQASPATFQSSATLAAGDAKVSIDGGALANLTTLPAVTPGSSKMVKISLSAAEMNGDNITVVFSDAAGSEWCDTIINIQTSARQVDDLAYPATSGRSMVVDAAGLVDANAVKVGPTGSGTAQTAADLAAALTIIDDFLDTEIAAIKAKTDNLPTDPADASDLAALVDALPTAAENATQLLDVAAGVETGLTVRQALRLMAAVLYGKGSGLSSTSVAYRDIGDTKNRVQAQVDADGNRSTVTLDAS